MAALSSSSCSSWVIDWALIIIGGRLALPSFAAEEGTDRFFPCDVVRHCILQLVDGLRTILA